MKVTLTKKQKHELAIQHDNMRNGRLCDCIKAVPPAFEGKMLL